MPRHTGPRSFPITLLMSVIDVRDDWYNMAVGTGGAGGAIAPPIFCQPKKFKSLKITTHKSVYSNKDKIGF